MTPTDPGPQRSAEAHSAAAPYAGDDAFTGGAHGGAGWPGARLESGDAVTAPLVSHVLCALLGCGPANAVGPGETGQARVSHGQYVVETAAALTAAKLLGAVAGVVGREAGLGVGAAAREGGQTLYHYTTGAGRTAILDSGELLASQGGKHARYGPGQYFADIAPEMIGGRTLAATPVGHVDGAAIREAVSRALEHGEVEPLPRGRRLGPWCATGRPEHLVD